MNAGSTTTNPRGLQKRASNCYFGLHTRGSPGWGLSAAFSAPTYIPTNHFQGSPILLHFRHVFIADPVAPPPVSDGHHRGERVRVMRHAHEVPGFRRNCRRVRRFQGGLASRVSDHRWVIISATEEAVFFFLIYHFFTFQLKP